MARAVVAHETEPTNAGLAAERGAEFLSPQAALAQLGPGDVALAARRSGRSTLQNSPAIRPPSGERKSLAEADVYADLRHVVGVTTVARVF